MTQCFLCEMDANNTLKDKRAILVPFFGVNFERLKEDTIKLEKLVKSEY